MKEGRKKGREEGRKTNWIANILLRNCRLKHCIEGELDGRIEVTGGRGRRHKQLLDDLKETRGYCKLKDEEVDRTPWGTGCGPVVRQNKIVVQYICQRLS